MHDALAIGREERRAVGGDGIVDGVPVTAQFWATSFTVRP